jgi:hypothetical protein
VVAGLKCPDFFSFMEIQVRLSCCSADEVYVKLRADSFVSNEVCLCKSYLEIS